MKDMIHTDNKVKAVSVALSTAYSKGLLKSDKRVLLTGCDIDGLPRGKTVMLEKIEKSMDDGFGFCGVLFGWDQHDALVKPPPPLLASDSGFSDILAKIDPSSMRRIPWNNNQPMFLVDFYHPTTGKPLAMCPRNLLKRIVGEFTAAGLRPLAGMEYEWFNFQETPDTLAQKKGVGLKPLTTGMFGYSLQRPHLNQQFFNDIFDHCASLEIPIECLHTETGPGVYEAALKYTDALELADRAHVFKMAVKQIGLNHKVTCCFMAKPHQDQPGCSGHIHISLASLETGASLFAMPKNSDTAVSDVDATMTPTMQKFIAGILLGLPSIMAIMAPTINSYKRLVENYWAPLTVSYGQENRTTSIRIIGPPLNSPESTRIEVRVPGADVNPYLAVAAILACGMHGIRNNLSLPFPPAKGDVTNQDAKLLPRTLLDAVQCMQEKNSMARLVLGDEFVDHFVATRLHELRLWSNAVTDWEIKRYMETI
ncbi:hypothetical protein QVD99_004615 [Batrachochytrium dendrobatidis]|nr:hypothetical protein QVD99_004615 [Batrachochytrium dendrobatidis]